MGYVTSHSESAEADVSSGLDALQWYDWLLLSMVVLLIVSGLGLLLYFTDVVHTCRNSWSQGSIGKLSQVVPAYDQKLSKKPTGGSSRSQEEEDRSLTAPGGEAQVQRIDDFLIFQEEVLRIDMEAKQRKEEQKVRKAEEENIVKQREEEEREFKHMEEEARKAEEEREFKHMEEEARKASKGRQLKQREEEAREEEKEFKHMEEEARKATEARQLKQ